VASLAAATLGLGRRAWLRRGGGLGEFGVVNIWVQVDLVDSNFLIYVGCRASGVDGKREFQAPDLAVVGEVGLDGEFLTFIFALALPFQKQRGIDIEEVEANIAIFVGELDTPNIFVVNFILAASST